MTRTDENLKEVAGRIARNRKVARLSQRELARRAGLSMDAVHRIESCSRNPSLKTFLELAAALGVNPTELLGGPVSGRRFRPRVERVASFLEGQPDEVVGAVDRCARIIADAVAISVKK
jgi:transcriptional regulator with XRE-family HTH domain